MLVGNKSDLRHLRSVETDVAKGFSEKECEFPVWGAQCGAHGAATIVFCASCSLRVQLSFAA